MKSYILAVLFRGLSLLARTYSSGRLWCGAISPEMLQWLEQNPNDDGIGSAIDCLWSIVVE
jgi:hypothetical protein